MTYVPAVDGPTVKGTYRRAITLTSDKFAVIGNERQSTLVPWRECLSSRPLTM